MPFDIYPDTGPIKPINDKGVNVNKKECINLCLKTNSLGFLYNNDDRSCILLTQIDNFKTKTNFDLYLYRKPFDTTVFVIMFISITFVFLLLKFKK